MTPIVQRTKTGKGAMVILNQTDEERAARRKRRIARAQAATKEAAFTTGQIRAVTAASRSRRGRG